ncbi:ATP synthase subunits region ORF 6 [Tsuneonella dongtanensis]|uniref:ATP synthase subunits region ORF 6 n=1 Tax=Tsuneonella dongtanensis TaxID=692370 RepID=A0A1B2ABE1_9SPHN|nr:glycosyltransferase [Tsuneonella dongtanensis]ANY19421.1 ATP synthase subunits region ORF 6 [Tsuneonella dongtanensis]
MTDGRASSPSIAVVAAVNDEAILANNLLRSPMIAEGRAAFHAYRGAHSASSAYNRGIDETSAEVVVFAHQDVFLPERWEADLRRAIALVASRDPDWAVIGGWGIDGAGKHAGHVWSSGLGRRLGGRFSDPVEAQCIDEYVIVLRRASGLRFDEGLPGFHLYAADIVLRAREAGLRSWIADIPAVHNSRTVRGFNGGYTDAWRFMQSKWRAHLPIETLTVPIVRSPIRLMWSRFRLWKSWRYRRAKAYDHTLDPRELVRRLEP